MVVWSGRPRFLMIIVVRLERWTRLLAAVRVRPPLTFDLLLLPLDLRRASWHHPSFSARVSRLFTLYHRIGGEGISRRPLVTHKMCWSGPQRCSKRKLLLSRILAYGRPTTASLYQRASENAHFGNCPKRGAGTAPNRE